MGRTKTGAGKISEPPATLRLARKKLLAGARKKPLSWLDHRNARLPHVSQVRVTGPFKLFLSFDDGLAGELDLASQLYGPVFEPLKDERYFGQVRVNPELGTVVWPNGADFAPEFLYDEVRRHSR